MLGGGYTENVVTRVNACPKYRSQGMGSFGCGGRVRALHGLFLETPEASSKKIFREEKK